jgi:hypothetical protein
VRFKPQQFSPWFLVALTIVLYWPVRHHGFVALDDQEYVSGNRQVQAGLTLEGVRWAFTTTAASNWHPLTWISHMLDIQLFGPGPGGQHLVNATLPRLQRRRAVRGPAGMTGALWRSAMVAALFAVHPLHVESVAWISERKDVLSSALGLLALWAYLRYVRRPGPGGYLLVAALFTLGLLAKPMLVTLPFVLLLLDFWPLGRRAGLATGRVSWPKSPRCSWCRLRRAWSRFRCRIRDGRSCLPRSTLFPCGSGMPWFRTRAILGKRSGRKASPSFTRGCGRTCPPSRSPVVLSVSPA